LVDAPPTRFFASAWADFRFCRWPATLVTFGASRAASSGVQEPNKHRNVFSSSRAGMQRKRTLPSIAD
jgi:hypothetical protein